MCTGLVYLLVYMVVIALEKDLGSVEPVSVKSKIQAQLHSYFEARSLPKSHFTPGSADLDSLVNSRMFKEQSSKLAWIKKRLQSYVVCACICCVCVFVYYIVHLSVYSMKTGWEEAAIILSERHPELFSSPKNILLFPGLVSKLMVLYPVIHMISIL